MQKQLIQFLCWTPIIGMLVEVMYVETYRENYLSSVKNPIRHFLAILWNVSWIMLVFVVPFFIR